MHWIADGVMLMICSV